MSWYRPLPWLSFVSGGTARSFKRGAIKRAKRRGRGGNGIATGRGPATLFSDVHICLPARGCVARESRFVEIMQFLAWNYAPQSRTPLAWHIPLSLECVSVRSYWGKVSGRFISRKCAAAAGSARRGGGTEDPFSSAQFRSPQKGNGSLHE